MSRAAPRLGRIFPSYKKGTSRLPRNRFCRRIASTTRRWLIRMKASHRELQLFGCPECDFLACSDLDRLTGCRIAPHTSCALPDLQDGKAGALLQILSECDPRKPGRTSKMARRFARLKSAGPLFDCGDLNGRPCAAARCRDAASAHGANPADHSDTTFTLKRSIGFWAGQR